MGPQPRGVGVGSALNFPILPGPAGFGLGFLARTPRRARHPRTCSASGPATGAAGRTLTSAALLPPPPSALSSLDPGRVPGAAPPASPRPGPGPVSPGRRCRSDSPGRSPDAAPVSQASVLRPVCLSDSGAVDRNLISGSPGSFSASVCPGRRPA